MLVITIPKTMGFTNGMEILDVYLHYQLPVDLVYPFLFAISYCLLSAYFLKKVNKFNSVFFYQCFLPIIGGLADYLENSGIISMLNDYSDISETVIQLISIFSIVKSITTTIFFTVLINTLLMLGLKTIKERKYNYWPVAELKLRMDNGVDRPKSDGWFISILRKRAPYRSPLPMEDFKH